MAPHSSTLAWKIHGWKSLVGCSPWGRYELDTTEQLRLHFSLSCIGEGNGSPQGSPVPGILQARTLEWVAISFSKEK